MRRIADLANPGRFGERPRKSPYKDDEPQRTGEYRRFGERPRKSPYKDDEPQRTGEYRREEREESSRRGAENPEIFGDCKLATSSILLLFLLHFVASTLGRDPATAFLLDSMAGSRFWAGEDMRRYDPLRRRARPNARPSAAGGVTRTGEGLPHAKFTKSAKCRCRNFSQ